MPNVELISNGEIVGHLCRSRTLSGFKKRPTIIPASSFLRHSCFVFFSNAFIQRAENRGFFRSDFFADKNKLGAGALKRFEVPTARHEIKKLRAIREANEAFGADHVRGKSVREMFKTIARQTLIRTERERFELEMMQMLRRLDVCFSADAK